jgi:hypothetical protein
LEDVLDRDCGKDAGLSETFDFNVCHNFILGCLGLGHAE